MAIRKPVGSKAVEVLDFTDPAWTNWTFRGADAQQSLYDDYANIAIEEDRKEFNLITTK